MFVFMGRARPSHAASLPGDKIDILGEQCFQSAHVGYRVLPPAIAVAVLVEEERRSLSCR